MRSYSFFTTVPFCPICLHLAPKRPLAILEVRAPARIEALGRTPPGYGDDDHSEQAAVRFQTFSPSFLANKPIRSGKFTQPAA